MLTSRGKWWLASLSIFTIWVGLSGFAWTGAAQALALDDGFLGVKLEEESESTTGALILEVDENSPAAKAGLKKDWRVVTCNDQKISHSMALIAILEKCSAGDVLRFGVVKPDGWGNEFKVTLAARKAGQAYLGVKVLEGTGGMRITEVRPGSPAAAAGLKPDDVIVEGNGSPLTSEDSFDKLLGGLSPGSALKLQVKRNGWAKTINVKLGALEDGPSKPVSESAGERKVKREEEAPRERKLGYLGVQIVSDEATGRLRVNQVFPETPAAKAGLKKGDLILKLAGKDVDRDGVLREILYEKGPGANVGIVVRRGEKTIELEIVLGEKR